MKSILRAIGGTACVLFAIIVGLWALSRALEPTDAQEAAVAVMRGQPSLNGRDAFQALWLMAYVVPESERAQVLAEDMRRHRQMPGGRFRDVDRSNAQATSAQGRYPGLVLTDEDHAMLCGTEGCLAKIMANRPQAARFVERYAPLIENAEALSGYGGIRHPNVAHAPDFLLPPYQLAKLPATRYALDFAEGRRLQAFQGVCRAVDTWRRLGANSDLLISRMLGVAYSSEVYARLFMEMLAETPADFALPPECTQAFVEPTGDELSMCDALRGEYAIFAEKMPVHLEGETEHAWVVKTFGPLLFSRDTTLADMAGFFSVYCSESLARDVARDVPMNGRHVAPGWKRFQCIGNAFGCILTEIAKGVDYDKYLSRIQDANARYRLIAAILRMRADTRDARPVAERLRGEAGVVGAPDRELGLTDDGRSVRMNNRSGRTPYTEFTLPRLSAPAGSVVTRAEPSLR